MVRTRLLRTINLPEMALSVERLNCSGAIPFMNPFTNLPHEHRHVEWLLPLSANCLFPAATRVESRDLQCSPRDSSGAIFLFRLHPVTRSSYFISAPLPLGFRFRFQLFPFPFGSSSSLPHLICFIYLLHISSGAENHNKITTRLSTKGTHTEPFCA